MTAPTGAIDTARCNLAQRIGRRHTEIEKAGREPDADEGAHLLEAVACLETANYPAGEDAMMQAEKGRRQRSRPLIAWRRRWSCVPRCRDAGPVMASSLAVGLSSPERRPATLGCRPSR